ncbi:MAG: CDP-glycerol--glycerophosphate glycerophosphotransferase [Pseudomonadales bacterium]|nr:CDP-glycerol--glycerophosphate glycerophosphotransferase [Pseudomonadales bacterium]
MSFRALFYIEQNYAYVILRPLQREIIARGGSVRWLLVGDEIDSHYLQRDEVSVANTAEAIAYAPDAVFAPGDRVPGFIPGLKVQVFHGLNEDKRGNIYPERGLFDLYCTEGPGRTAMLQPLAAQRGYFKVCETGWLKLDSLLAKTGSRNTGDASNTTKPHILFASTFTPRLSCAEVLFDTIAMLARSGNWQWLLTLHPKMADATVARYRSLVGPNVEFGEADQVIDYMHRADVMVCDNSSILQEFLLLQKPVVTVGNRAPQPCMINITEPDQLEDALRRALQPDPALQRAIADYGASITPFLDGQSSGRVYAAVRAMLDSAWRDNKPRNYWRNWKMRRQLHYYKFW